ncbi:MAG: hypothetical protein AAGU27_10340 [Dehalobacterium sp.]
MTKALNGKKLTFFLAVLLVIGCMVVQALAAQLTVTTIWQPTTPSQTPGEPYTVYMDTGASDVERLAWKTLSEDWNPDFTGVWRAERYVGNNNDPLTNMMYSYTFNAAQIDQGLVNQQPYYLLVEGRAEDGVNKIFMGCRTKFPVAMTVKVKLPSSFYVTGVPYNSNVRISYIDESCNGYVNHSATGGSDLAGTVVEGDPDYLDGFNPTFSYVDTTVDANGYVEFTTHHGGDYSVVPFFEED